MLIYFIMGFLAACGGLALGNALKGDSDLWEYGRCNEKHARKNKASGRVYFVLWQAGKQGHMVEYWAEFGTGWAAEFTPYKKHEINCESGH